VSQRLRAAHWNADGDAAPALVRLLGDLDVASRGDAPGADPSDDGAHR
jgi:hypothetical protein